MATRYPGSGFDSGTDLGFLTVANVRSGSVSATLTSGGTTLQVDFDPASRAYPSAGYLALGPASGPWEVVRYSSHSPTGGNPGSFTLSARGLDGTSAAQHEVGELVGMPPIAEQVNALAGAVIALEAKLGLGASSPATGGKYLRTSGTASITGWSALLATDINTALGGDALTTQYATTINRLAKWSSSDGNAPITRLADSIIGDDGSTATVNGGLVTTGTVKVGSSGATLTWNSGSTRLDVDKRVNATSLMIGSAAILSHNAGAYPYVGVNEGLRVEGRLNAVGDQCEVQGTLRFTTNSYAQLSFVSTTLRSCSGSTAAMGGIGSGPASTGQVGWIQVKVGANEDTAWIPYWA